MPTLLAMTNLSRSLSHTFAVFLFALIFSCADAATSNLFGPSTAITSRYWDCCKPSCGWADKAGFVDKSPVQSCDINQNPLLDNSQGTGCNGGHAFGCPTNAPWAVNDTFSYGFVGTFLVGGDESSWCCSCYQLNFTSGAVKGKSMIVQASNTNYDSPNANVFTLGIPGGNTSYAGACGIEYSVSDSVFGTKNVGLLNRADCDNLPAALKPGCQWRFDWFNDAEGPNVEYKRVTCPKVLTDITKCKREDDDKVEADAIKANSPSAASTLPSMVPTAISALLMWCMLQTLG
ncbi:hypothetical protein VE01_04513 [Pseudogymnoascus verrucosus]|uniref:cellulase n=1 Tax=Pseudogymnoascus verrucosus TaxID=342668 RepID=A0A1B8GP28_9PEZI|nr:uncharacterized protein VE01_04513 [Pseudogymnoascus verrucosus]OBT97587.1 hypothetical protein VE01_04513 [Pseudogymnoascus verrucosus]